MWGTLSWSFAPHCGDHLQYWQWVEEKGITERASACSAFVPQYCVSLWQEEASSDLLRFKCSLSSTFGLSPWGFWLVFQGEVSAGVLTLMREGSHTLKSIRWLNTQHLTLDRCPDGLWITYTLSPGKEDTILYVGLYSSYIKKTINQQKLCKGNFVVTGGWGAPWSMPEHMITLWERFLVLAGKQNLLGWEPGRVTVDPSDKGPGLSHSWGNISGQSRKTHN